MINSVEFGGRYLLERHDRDFGVDPLKFHAIRWISGLRLVLIGMSRTESRLKIQKYTFGSVGS